jgi:hypothetical protein
MRGYAAIPSDYGPFDDDVPLAHPGGFGLSRREGHAQLNNLNSSEMTIARTAAGAPR